MHVLRIEHSVTTFEAWKEAFEGDPLGRERSGVRSYRILRGVDDPDYVMIDLEFEGAGEAEAFLARLQDLWGRIDVMRDPTGRVAELVETGEY